MLPPQPGAGGSVRVEDGVPRGARFVVDLPRAVEDE